MARLRTWHVIPLAVLAVAAALPAAVAVPASAAATTYTITNLGSLGYVGYDTTEPMAINASGQVAGFSDTATIITFPCPGHYKPPRTCSSHPQRAFLYRNGTMTDLGSLGGPDRGSSADAINRSGEVAGISQTATGKSDAALWTGTTTVDLGALAPLSSGSRSGATGINDSGQVVGYWGTTSTGAYHGFLDSNGTVTDLGSFTPFALNDNGVMVDGGDQIDSGGTVQNLDNLIPANSGYQIAVTFAINDNGQIVAEANGSAVLLTPN